METTQHITTINEKVVFSGKGKGIALGISAVGLILVLVAVFARPSGVPEEMYNTRLWANFLLSNFYFTAIAATSVLIIAIQYLANAGWFTALLRIPQAISAWLPFAFVSFLIIILSSLVSNHGGMYYLYVWSHLDEVKKSELLTAKQPWLNMPFFAIRMIIYFGLWILISRMYVKQSRLEDANGGILNFNRSWKLSAYALPAYGVTFSMACWDWLMSLEPEWYSTMYMVNVFASAFVLTWVVIALIAMILQSNGHMKFINENHYHDLGKFIFAFSVFWAYTWVGQFLLIWYANLPEEIKYFKYRWATYNWHMLWLTNLIMNFVFPFLFLMMRNAKRRTWSLGFAGVILLMCKYSDWYLLVMPKIVGNAAGFGFPEIGFFLLYLGLFAFVVGNALSKANIAPLNHPYLGESLHHEI